MESKHDCPFCVCGMIPLEWSDRCLWVFPKDVDQIADALESIALDGPGHRGSGIPHNLEEIHKDLPDKIRPILEKHLGVIDPQWRTKYVDMSKSQREAFLSDLKSTIRECIS